MLCVYYHNKEINNTTMNHHYRPPNPQIQGVTFLGQSVCSFNFNRCQIIFQKGIIYHISH